MFKRNTRRILLLIAIIVGVAVLGPALFGQPREPNSGDPWRNFVYDFQTLLTGIFAVGAATWTVLTMEATDTRSEQRHRQLMAVSLRSEIHAIDRALNPQINDIQDILIDLWSTDYDPFDADANNWEWFSNIAKRNFGDVDELKGIIQRPQLANATPYFNGELLRALDEFAGLVDGVRSIFSEHIAALENNERQLWHAFASYENRWENSMFVRCERALLMIQSGHALVSVMKRTLGEYENLKTRFSV